MHSLTDVYYHPGSPWGGKTSSDPTVGDIHQWNVWHGSQEPYQDWDKLAGRFVSEFGKLRPAGGMFGFVRMLTFSSCS